MVANPLVSTNQVDSSSGRQSGLPAIHLTSQWPLCAGQGVMFAWGHHLPTWAVLRTVASTTGPCPTVTAAAGCILPLCCVPLCGQRACGPNDATTGVDA